MRLNFTARKPKPKPKPAAVEPLKTPEQKAGRPKELGGPSGPEPTRYGDWERKGICVDF
ncbi:MAG: DUF1674 domain-containing protein [Kiloniellaceae bacterium]